MTAGRQLQHGACQTELRPPEGALTDAEFVGNMLGSNAVIDP